MAEKIEVVLIEGDGSSAGDGGSQSTNQPQSQQSSSQPTNSGLPAQNRRQETETHNRDAAKSFKEFLDEWLKSPMRTLRQFRQTMMMAIRDPLGAGMERVIDGLSASFRALFGQNKPAEHNRDEAQQETAETILGRIGVHVEAIRNKVVGTPALPGGDDNENPFEKQYRAKNLPAPEDHDEERPRGRMMRVLDAAFERFGRTRLGAALGRGWARFAGSRFGQMAIGAAGRIGIGTAAGGAAAAGGTAAAAGTVLGPFVVVVLAATAALGALVGAIKLFTNIYEKQAMELQGVSGPIAAAVAQRDVNRELARIRRAEEIGPDVARIFSANTRLQDATYELWTQIYDLMGNFAPQLEKGLDGMTIGVQGITTMVEIAELWTKTPGTREWFHQRNEAAAHLALFAGNVKAWTNTDYDNPPENTRANTDPLFDDLFGKLNDRKNFNPGQKSPLTDPIPPRF